jgi:hypothetical protein
MLSEQQRKRKGHGLCSNSELFHINSGFNTICIQGIDLLKESAEEKSRNH